MNFLEQKILADGVVKPGNVLKVDSFLNHQIDIRLMQKIGEEFKRRFADVQFNKVLTIEASGIAIAAFIAYLNDVPVVFAKKGQTVNSTDDKYVAKAYSFTHKKFNDIFVSRPYLKPTDKILIVDQAHGAHLRFMGEGYPMSAEEGGADIVINSTHKTLASWTQTAVMNVMSDRVDLGIVEDNLQILESSSPSYPLMMSLDINAEILLDPDKKRMAFGEWESAVEIFYERAKDIPGLRIIEDPMLDRTKLNFDMSACGLSGNDVEAAEFFAHVYHVQVDLVAAVIVHFGNHHALQHDAHAADRIAVTDDDLSLAIFRYAGPRLFQQRNQGVVADPLEKLALPQDACILPQILFHAYCPTYSILTILYN